MANNNNLVIALIVGVAALLLLGVIPMPDFGGQDDEDSGSNLPSDMSASVTLNTGDRLATSTTDADVDYYVFSASGQYLKSGSTSNGTDSFSVGSDKEFEMILYDDDDAGSDYLPEKEEFNTKGEHTAELTINTDLIKESAATIESVRDPIDLDGEISIGSGSTSDFDVLVSATTSNAGLRKPTLLVDVNKTEIEDVNFVGLNEIDCPDRVSADSGYKTYCFQDDAIVQSKDGTQIYAGTLKASDSVTPDTSSNATVTVADEGIYRESDYRTAGIEAFKYGLENPVTNDDVGASDSSSDAIGFDG